MARFLFVSYAAAGHLTPALSVARALVGRGHQVAVLTAPTAAGLVEAAGATTLPGRRWRATLDRIEPAATAPSRREAIRRVRHAVRDVMFADAPATADDLEEALGEWPADVVVSSDTTSGVSLAMGRARRRWATLAALITCPLSSRELPPWGAGLPVPRTGLDRLRMRLLRGVIGGTLAPLRREWSATRARYGLPPVGGDLVEALASPYLYMIPSSLAFDRRCSDRPAHVHHVGPCLPPPSAEGAWPSPFPPGRPLVYATAGTVHNARPFLATLVEAARGEPYDLFVTAGWSHDPSAWPDLPPNVRMVPFVPQDLVMRSARLVLCNGGSGAVMGALVAGRPLVLIPLAADQPENARRCVERGVGLQVGSRPLRPGAVRRAVRQVLDDDGYRARAEELGAALRREDGPARASDLLEALSREGR